MWCYVMAYSSQDLFTYIIKKKISHLPSVLSILIHHCKSFWFCLRSLRYLDLRFVLLPWYTVMVNVILFDILHSKCWQMTFKKLPQQPGHFPDKLHRPQKVLLIKNNHTNGRVNFYPQWHSWTKTVDSQVYGLFTLTVS